MKTANEIKAHIEQIVKEMGPFTLEDKVYKKASKEVAKLRSYLYYLETSPTEGICEKHLENLKTKLRIIESRFSQWLASAPKAKELKNPKQSYYSEFEVKKIKNQIEALKYILS